MKVGMMGFLMHGQGKKINLQINRTVILVCAEPQFSLDILSVPLLQVHWPIIAVQALILHSFSQSPGQVGWCHGSSLFTTLPPSETMCTPRWPEME